jgi:hypothetical protein
MTPSDQRHIENVISLGCLVCRLTGKGATPAEFHHLLRNGRRLGHRYGIPLCYVHHRSGRNDDAATSRHPWRKEFEKRYGTENDLLRMTNDDLKRKPGEPHYADRLPF